MPATIAELYQILIFRDLEPKELEHLQPYSQVQHYQQGEILMHEGDCLPAKLYNLLRGSLRISKTASTGKETILRTILAGEIFAAWHNSFSILLPNMAPSRVQQVSV